MWDSPDSCSSCACSTRSRKADNQREDKENVPQALSPVKLEDESFYGCQSSPVPFCDGNSPNHCNHNSGHRRPLEDYDPNSQDSGYGTNFNDAGKLLSFESSSTGSMEDDFFQELAGIEPLDDNLPEDFNKLITGPFTIQTRNVIRSPREIATRVPFRRALSLQDNTTPNSSRVRSCLFRAESDVRAFKRPEPVHFDSPISKKIKVMDTDEDVVLNISRPVLKRHFSASAERIKWAVHKSSTELDLIGDFSKTFTLPLTKGRHHDLTSISASTVARLINGDFNSSVASFKVIDCRYPYEYDGGHIDGAINLYTKEQCLGLLQNAELTPLEESNKRRNILVFHCEFSSERGPNLYRYLRKEDRQMNQESYPALHYPEVYLLEGGYKSFFQDYSHLCVPVAYKEMHHPEHEHDFRYFRQKCKTWNADSRQRPRNDSKKHGL